MNIATAYISVEGKECGKFLEPCYNTYRMRLNYEKSVSIIWGAFIYYMLHSWETGSLSVYLSNLRQPYRTVLSRKLK